MEILRLSAAVPIGRVSKVDSTRREELQILPGQVAGIRIEYRFDEVLGGCPAMAVASTFEFRKFRAK